MKAYHLANLNEYRCGRQGKCCHGWSVFFSQSMLARIHANIDQFPEVASSPHDFYTVTHPNIPNYYASVKFVKGVCPFFNQQSKNCHIFETLGFANGNPVCQSYPFTRLLLKDRVHYISSLSCVSEINRMLNRQSLCFESSTETPEKAQWVTLDYSHKTHLVFYQQVNLSLHGYYVLEHLINELGNSDITFSQVLSCLPLLQYTIEHSDNLNTLGDWKKYLPATPPTPEHPASKEKPHWIEFFIQRKINLYQFEPFIEDATPFINWIRSEKNRPLSLTDKEQTYIKHYFLLKHFSHISFFARDILSTWHQLCWLSVCLLLRKRYLENTQRLSHEQSLHQATEWVEKNFYHDATVFELWGSGIRGQKDLEASPLTLWLNCFCQDTEISVLDILSHTLHSMREHDEKEHDETA